MDNVINEARKSKLRNWIRNDFEGSVAAFVRNFGLPNSTASYISQLFSGNRNFGEKAARQLESQTGMPVGWFDEEVAKIVPPGIEPPLFRYDRSRAAKLPASERELVSAFIEFLVQRNEGLLTMPVSETLNLNRVTSLPQDQKNRIREGARSSKSRTYEGARRTQGSRKARSG